MKKLVKYGLWVSAVLGLLLTVALIGTKLLLNPNHFKPQLIAWVKQRTGATLSIPGTVELTLLPFPGLKIGKLLLYHQTTVTQTPLAQADFAAITVAWLPLLRNQLHIHQLSFKDLTLYIRTNQQGENNWTRFLRAPTLKVSNTTTPSRKPNTNTSETLSIAQLAISNGRILWDDQQQGSSIRLDKLQINAQPVAFGQPIHCTMAFELKPLLAQPVHLTTQLTIARSGMQLQALTLNSHNLTLNADLHIQALFKQPTVQGRLKLNTPNLKEFLQQQGIATFVTQDAAALGNLSASVMLHADTQGIQFQDLDAHIDQSTLHSSGTLQYEPSTHIRFKAAVDKLDVDRYMVNQAPVPVLSTAILLGASTWSGNTWAQLKALTFDSQLEIQQLKMRQLTMHDVTLKLRSQAGQLYSEQHVNQLYQGRYQGRATLDLSKQNAQLTIDEALNQVQLDPMLQALQSKLPLSGILTSTLHLQAQGTNAQAVKESVQGTLNLALNQGSFKNFNLAKLLANARQLVNDQPVPSVFNQESSPFERLKATINMQRGRLTNEDLMIISDKLTVTGNGSLDVNADQWDYRLHAQFNNPERKPSAWPLTLVLHGPLAAPQVKIAGLSEFLRAHQDEINSKKALLLEKVDRVLQKNLGTDAKTLLKKLF